MSTTKQIKALTGFHHVTDADVLNRGIQVETSLTGNSHFPNPPVDLATLKAALDTFAALIPQALDRSKKVIAEKKKQRTTVIQMLKVVASYVDMVSNGDMTVFQTSGFQATSPTRAANTPLSEKIRKLDRGDNSGEILAWIQTVRGASSYELRYGAVVNGAAPAVWTSLPLSGVKQAVTITGLATGTSYMFQARALARNKFTDWSDPVTFVCG
jgi:hypothetical protein